MLKNFWALTDLGGSLVTIGRDNIKTFNIENNDPVAEYYCDVMLKKCILDLKRQMVQ